MPADVGRPVHPTVEVTAASRSTTHLLIGPILRSRRWRC
jgi:hypothetical protein